MTTLSRFEDLAERIDPTEGSPRIIHPGAAGRALLDFATGGALPTRAEDIGLARADAAGLLLAREFVLDLEEAGYLAAGGDPDSSWLTLLDACRDGGTPAADARLRRAANGLDDAAPASILVQLRVAVPGRHEIRVTELSPA